MTVYPMLAEMDLVRFTLDVDASMDEIASLVGAVFAPSKAGVSRVRRGD